MHFVPAVLDRAKAIVAEINAAMPRPAQSYRDPVRPPGLGGRDRAPAGGPRDRRSAAGDPIGSAQNVASLIEDGDTIQIGIGKVPAAVLGSLRDRRDLGLHGGLVSDEVAELHAAGVLTGARKSHERGTMVCTAALGSARVYEWAGRCPELRFAPGAATPTTPA